MNILKNIFKYGLLFTIIEFANAEVNDRHYQFLDGLQFSYQETRKQFLINTNNNILDYQQLIKLLVASEYSDGDQTATISGDLVEVLSLYAGEIVAWYSSEEKRKRAIEIFKFGINGVSTKYDPDAIVILKSEIMNSLLVLDNLSYDQDKFRNSLVGIFK